MSDDQEEINSSDDVVDININPGDCFGWYSSVSPDCSESKCLKSEWCRSYTLTRANESSNSMKKNLDDIGQDSTGNITEAKLKTNKNLMADLGRQAFFDKIVNFVASKTLHDNIKYNPKRDAASIKVGGKVLFFLAKKKSIVILQSGGRNKDGASLKIEMREMDEAMSSEILSFIKKYGD